MTIEIYMVFVGLGRRVLLVRIKASGTHPCNVIFDIGLSVRFVPLDLFLQLMFALTQIAVEEYAPHEHTSKTSREDGGDVEHCVISSGHHSHIL